MNLKTGVFEWFQIVRPVDGQLASFMRVDPAAIPGIARGAAEKQTRDWLNGTGIFGYMD